MIKIDYEYIEQARDSNEQINVSCDSFHGILIYLERLSKSIGTDLFLGKSQKNGRMIIFSGGGYGIAHVEERHFDNDIIPKLDFYNLVAQNIVNEISYIDHLPINIFDKDLCKLISKRYQGKLIQDLANSDLKKSERNKSFKSQMNDLNSRLKRYNKSKIRHDNLYKEKVF